MSTVFTPINTSEAYKSGLTIRASFRRMGKKRVNLATTIAIVTQTTVDDMGK